MAALLGAVARVPAPASPALRSSRCGYFQPAGSPSSALCTALASKPASLQFCSVNTLHARLCAGRCWEHRETRPLLFPRISHPGGSGAITLPGSDTPSAALQGQGALAPALRESPGPCRVHAASARQPLQSPRSHAVHWFPDLPAVLSLGQVNLAGSANPSQLHPPSRTWWGTLGVSAVLETQRR